MNNKEYKIIDAHCHIYPEKIALKAAKGTGDFYGEMPACSGTLDELLETGKAAGIDHFVVQSVATTSAQVRKINEFIAQQISEHPETLTGLGTLHPDCDNIAEEVSFIKILGLKGVKLHPDIQRFKLNDERCFIMYQCCEKAGLPMLIHTGDKRYDYSNPNRLEPILERYKDLLIIGAHMGGWSIWEEACDKLRKYDNLVVDCSSTLSYISPSLSKQLIRAYGADRVLFGTDYPLHLPQKEMRLFQNLELTQSEYRVILNSNAKRIFGIEI